MSKTKEDEKAVDLSDPHTIYPTISGDFFVNGSLSIASPPYYGKSRNQKLSEALHLLPVHMIKRCLLEMDNINFYTGSEDLDLALSITEESKDLTIKLLKLRGW